MMYKGRFFTSTKMLAIYSPIMPMNKIVIPLKNAITDISDVQPAMVEPLKYAKIVQNIKITLRIDIKTPNNVMKCKGTAEKLEIPLRANKIIFFSGYLVTPASRFLRS